MSYVAKTYEFIDKLQKLFNKKLFNVLFVAFASMGLFFGVMNIYAQENTAGTVDITSVSIKPNWKGIKTFINLANGVNKLEDNMGSQGSLNMANTAYTALAIMAPNVTAGADEIKNDSDIPKDMKAGLIGMADNAITYAYVNYPVTNVPQHLAQEWIPGYEESQTGLYAQSDTPAKSGYDTLMASGIAPLWNKIRNLAYVFFVVVMIAVGFMIMFRSKIGGQTLVSLGNFLPGVITSLILITFSFAIAGLLIDIGGIVVSLIAGLYGGNLSGINSIGSLFMSLFTGEIKSVALGTGITGGIVGILGILAAVASAAIAPILGGVGIIGLLLMLVVVGIIFIGGIKVLITLYKAFFGILLNVVVGPIQIMMGAFPGKGYSTSNWFKSLLKNVLTFPMVFAIVNLPTFIAAQTGISLSLPEKLSYANNNGMDVGLTNGGFTSFIVMFILRIVVLYFAAESPKYLEAWFPSDTPKPVAEGLANAKGSLSKIPLVGGLFK